MPCSSPQTSFPRILSCSLPIGSAQKSGSAQAPHIPFCWNKQQHTHSNSTLYRYTHTHTHTHTQPIYRTTQPAALQLNPLQQRSPTCRSRSTCRSRRPSLSISKLFIFSNTEKKKIEHFLKCLLKCFLTDFGRPTSEKIPA